VNRPSQASNVHRRPKLLSGARPSFRDQNAAPSPGAKVPRRSEPPTPPRAPPPCLSLPPRAKPLWQASPPRQSWCQGHRLIVRNLSCSLPCRSSGADKPGSSRFGSTLHTRLSTPDHPPEPRSISCPGCDSPDGFRPILPASGAHGSVDTGMTKVMASLNNVDDVILNVQYRMADYPIDRGHAAVCAGLTRSIGFIQPMTWPSTVIAPVLAPGLS
jgi:hypothetical protein